MNDTKPITGDLFQQAQSPIEETKVPVNLSIEPVEYIPDSDEERFFIDWLEELILFGFVKHYYRPKSYLLSSNSTYELHIPAKSKRGTDKTVERKLLAEHLYTPDFKITWTEKAYGIFHEPITEKQKNKDCPFFSHYNHFDNSYYSIVEVKPVFDRNNMTRLFVINQKWVYERYKIFVNLVKIPTFFKTTFVPQKYLFTDKKGQPRKIHFKVILVADYLKRYGYGNLG